MCPHPLEDHLWGIAIHPGFLHIVACLQVRLLGLMNDVEFDASTPVILGILGTRWLRDCPLSLFEGQDLNFPHRCCPS